MPRTPDIVIDRGCPGTAVPEPSAPFGWLWGLLSCMIRGNSAVALLEMVKRISSLNAHVQLRPLNTRPGAPVSAPADTTLPRVAIFLDGAGHQSGVTTTVRQWLDQAQARGQDMQVLCCSDGVETGREFVRFAPAWAMEIPFYPGLPLGVPDHRQVRGYLREVPCDLVHVATPGPMGLAGLSCARTLGIPVCGTYHTDFPAYAETLTSDRELVRLSWLFLQWFYGQVNRIAVPSVATRQQLIRHGFPASSLRVIGRGVDTNLFRPRPRSEPGKSHEIRLLYVGRLSPEKNLACLASAFKIVIRRGYRASLTVVGAGPCADGLRKELEGLPVFLPGMKKERELAEAYAAADLFVFPSLTDTLGNVVLEAQASGLPAIVSSAGGPKECVRHGLTGIVLPEMTPETLAHGIASLLDDPGKLRIMGEEARRLAELRTPAAAFEALLALYHDAARHAGANAA